MGKGTAAAVVKMMRMKEAAIEVEFVVVMK